MATLDYSQFTKIQKIAAFFVIIGPESAAEMMKEFDSAQLELICREIANLPVIEKPVQRRLLEEFGGLITAGATSVLGGVGYAQTVLTRAKGGYAAASIINRVAPAPVLSEGGEEIRQMEGREILNVVKSEQPQTIAFILSYMDAPKAAEIVSMLAPEMREEVIERLGSMEPTSRDVINKIAKNLNSHFDRKEVHQGLHRSGGAKNVAEILNALDKDMRNVLLSHLEDRNAVLGATIRKNLFSFEDLVRLERTDLQRIMRDVDMGDLAIALKGAKPELMTGILGVISKRAAEGLKEDIEMLGPVKSKDVVAAQDRVIQVVRKLEEAEEISLDPGGAENAIV